MHWRDAVVELQARLCVWRSVHGRSDHDPLLMYRAGHQVTTEKMIRAQLAEQTGADMAPRKGFVREQV